MSNAFFEHPILNSPCACPEKHWELDKQGQPTQQVIEKRRRAEFITPIPNPLPRPNTLRIDSEQLEAGDALDDNFRAMAADELERFYREIVERTGDARIITKAWLSQRDAASHSKFRRFVNITQLMMFSNNMEYDDNSHEPLEGAFYATTSYEKPDFNYFREENPSTLPVLPPVDADTETLILSDNNLHSLKHSAEFETNKNPNSPTNRLSSSLFSRQRLAFLLRYGIAYVRGLNGFEKHVMRYPQIFATHAIEAKIESGTRKGIIWHTQGSGKTALAYYNVKHLTDYYQGKGVVPKFYFIVDRIDLLTQAAREFRSRGLMVHEVDSREEFTQDIKSTKAIHNDSGKLEITVVNIQKFADDPNVVRSTGRAGLITQHTLERFDGPVICSNFCKAISIREETWSHYFMRSWKRLYDNGVLFSWEGKTSGIKNLLFDSFILHHKVPIPPDNLLKRFHDIIEPQHALSQKLLIQNQELTQLRDWLLPMLMNGQVTVGS